MAISLHKLSSILSISIFLLFFFPFSLSNRCRSQESEALLRVKAALNVSQGILSSWVNGIDCCTKWEGISCNNHTNHVVSVEVDADYLNSFQGVISESLCQLPFLTSLQIDSSRVPGTIPPCLGNLSHIHSLYLSGYLNGLSGTIPDSICLLTRLTELDLPSNKLTGSIPSCLGNLASLTVLDLSGNQLSGSIPAPLGSLPLLWDLYLGFNQLSGNIPSSFAQLSCMLLEIVSMKPYLLRHFHLLYVN